MSGRRRIDHDRERLTRDHTGQTTVIHPPLYHHGSLTGPCYSWLGGSPPVCNNGRRGLAATLDRAATARRQAKGCENTSANTKLTPTNYEASNGGLSLHVHMEIPRSQAALCPAFTRWNWVGTGGARTATGNRRRRRRPHGGIAESHGYDERKYGIHGPKHGYGPGHSALF